MAASRGGMFIWSKLGRNQIFSKLSLQVENDKIRLKTQKKIGGHRARFEDKAHHRP